MKLWHERKKAWVDYGCVFQAPGTTNFDGRGWPHQKPLEGIGLLDMSGMTFVGKTMTLLENPGNMPIGNDWQPKERYPKCIWINFRTGDVVNNVGLTGPGTKAIFDSGCYQKRKDNFFMSFMPKGDTARDRVKQAEAFVKIAEKYLPGFCGYPGLHFNGGCPNSGIDPAILYREYREVLLTLRALRIPLVLNTNPLTPWEAIAEVEECLDAASPTNTTPIGSTREIDWQRVTRDGRSPLPKRMGMMNLPEKERAEFYEKNKGGLSSEKCLSLVFSITRSLRQNGFKKAIIGGNSIKRKPQVMEAWLAGCNAIANGSVTMTRPWRTRGITEEALRMEEKGLWDIPYGLRAKAYADLIQQPQH